MLRPAHGNNLEKNWSTLTRALHVCLRVAKPFTTLRMYLCLSKPFYTVQLWIHAMCAGGKLNRSERAVCSGLHPIMLHKQIRGPSSPWKRRAPGVGIQFGGNHKINTNALSSGGGGGGGRGSGGE